MQPPLSIFSRTPKHLQLITVRAGGTHQLHQSLPTDSQKQVFQKFKIQTQRAARLDLTASCWICQAHPKSNKHSYCRRKGPGVLRTRLWPGALPRRRVPRWAVARHGPRAPRQPGRRSGTQSSLFRSPCKRIPRGLQSSGLHRKLAIQRLLVSKHIPEVIQKKICKQ